MTTTTTTTTTTAATTTPAPRTRAVTGGTDPSASRHEPAPPGSRHEPAPPADTSVWTPVCRPSEILPDTGVAALVAGRQIAIFRLRDHRLFAIDNHDPCSGANVLARGIVGDVDGEPVVASPIHKQRFELATGRCLDDAARVARHPVRTRGGLVEVGA
jgi:nitrite reductase (NADH) small subunit